MYSAIIGIVLGLSFSDPFALTPWVYIWPIAVALFDGVVIFTATTANGGVATISGFFFALFRGFVSFFLSALIMGIAAGLTVGVKNMLF